MVVLILSAAPASLRGSMTRWLLEVSPGVFVGRLSARVREQLWELVRAYIGEGRALLIWSVRSEQRFAIASLGHEREPGMILSDRAISINFFRKPRASGDDPHGVFSRYVRIL